MFEEHHSHQLIPHFHPVNNFMDSCISATGETHLDFPLLISTSICATCRMNFSQSTWQIYLSCELFFLSCVFADVHGRPIVGNLCYSRFICPLLFPNELFLALFWRYTKQFSTKKQLHSFSSPKISPHLFRFCSLSGLYLYMLVVQTFSGDNIKFNLYAVIGWGELIWKKVWIRIVGTEKQIKRYHRVCVAAWWQQW
jgi:hypothetical protein